MNITEYIPASVRKPVYGALAVIGLVVGSAQVAYAAIEVANPEWLTISLAVFPFIAAAVGFTAQGSTDPSHPITGEEPVEEADESAEVMEDEQFGDWSGADSEEVVGYETRRDAVDAERDF